MEQRLKNYAGLKLELKFLRERIARMKSEEEFPTMRESDGAQHPSGTADRMERAIIRRMECEAALEEILEEMQCVERFIDGLKSPMERTVLRLRYLEAEGGWRLTWKDVALQVYGDDEDRHVTSVKRIHKKALQK